MSIRVSSRTTKSAARNNGIGVRQESNPRSLCHIHSAVIQIEVRLINELKIESEKTQVDLKKSGIIIYKFANTNGKTETGKFINVKP
ncbi:MAG: hypothetical protein CVU05_14310 [Bacteroidetes bacterium HGW-Bacteroidetes-21]|jgi:hypothetical protein|nr:MAG: hypothetical protein CVU05_14310 [Bacteroidetes bacterium HGW-Bacteroidetes-21]